MLTFLLVCALLFSDAVIFFTVGYSTRSIVVVKALKRQGWTIEPPDVDREVNND